MHEVSFHTCNGVRLSLPAPAPSKQPTGYSMNDTYRNMEHLGNSTEQKSSENWDQKSFSPQMSSRLNSVKLL
jgi:hypothetical protein